MKDNLIFKDIRNKVCNKGENCIVVFLGKVRWGKSLCAAAFSKHIIPAFDVTKNIAYTIQDFYRMLNDEDVEHTAIMIEELGIKMDKRRFMSLQNVYLSWTFQTFAHKQILLVITCPSMKYIDSRLTPLIDYVFTTKRAFKTGRMLTRTKFKVRVWEHNPEIEKTYKKKPKFCVGGKWVKINTIIIPVPPEDVIQEYKKSSTVYKNQLNKMIEAEIGSMAQGEKEEEKSKEIVSNEEIIRFMLDNRDKYFIKYRGKSYIPSKAIMAVYDNISRNRAEKLSAKINIIIGEEDSPTQNVETESLVS